MPVGEVWTPWQLQGVGLGCLFQAGEVLRVLCAFPKVLGRGGAPVPAWVPVGKAAWSWGSQRLEVTGQAGPCAIGRGCSSCTERSSTFPRVLGLMCL